MKISKDVHVIIKCLSREKNAFITPEEYHLPGFETKETNRYENYLYE